MLLLITFVPLGRLLPMHPDQRLFHPDGRTILIYVILNGWLVSLGLIALIVPMMVVSPGLVPSSWRDAVTAQPYWLQTLQVLIIAA